MKTVHAEYSGARSTRERGIKQCHLYGRKERTRGRYSFRHKLPPVLEDIGAPAVLEVAPSGRGALEQAVKGTTPVAFFCTRSYAMCNTSPSSVPSRLLVSQVGDFSLWLTHYRLSRLLSCISAMRSSWPF